MITAAAAPVLALLVAGVLTTANATSTRSQLQDAMDAAVLAGARSSTVPDVQKTIAQQHFSAIAAEALERGELSAATFSADGETVSGTATFNTESVMGAMLGSDTVAVRVKATAIRTQYNLCILGLNNLDNGSFDINGTPKFNAPDCGVQANSGSTRAMTQEGTVRALAGVFAVKGGQKTNNFYPRPEVGADKIEDPYADLPFPSHDSCTRESARKGLVVTENTTLKPGTYCGGINITGKSLVVRLEPGIYVMVDGSLLVNGNARLEGEQVLIAFTGTDATLRIWGGSSVELTSPTSGVYKNVQFFQDRFDPRGRGMWVSIGGNGGPNDETDTSKLRFDGAAYFPTQNFWVYGAADVDMNSPGVVLVADKIWFQGAATIDVTQLNSRDLRDFVADTVYSSGARLIK